MLSANTLRVLARHGLSGLVSEAKRAGGDAFAARTAKRFLAMICDAAVQELGCTRARVLVKMQIERIERGGGRMERYKGYLDGEGGEAECVVEASPRGGWNLDEVTPSDLPEGSYELTFGDRNEKNPGGISKQGEAHHRGGTWTVEDVRDA